MSATIARAALPRWTAPTIIERIAGIPGQNSLPAAIKPICRQRARTIPNVILVIPGRNS